MDEKERQQALLTALTTEHFVLQTSRGATIAESVGRATIFLSTLSAALIGLGFAAGKSSLIGPYLGAAVPSLIVLGWLTFVRLVESSVENYQDLVRLRDIRAYYREHLAAGTDFFADAVAHPERGRAAWGITGSQNTSRWREMFYTSAALIGAIDSLLLGLAAILLLGPVAGLPGLAAVPIGILIVLVAFAGHLIYLRHAFDEAGA
ncbi:hypothetical protein ACFFWC_30325 [Plantactinospora siamensis]|uniref:Uncharacterized protein n=1 Tax=Plantactinospora siamensis TaxID=555372 RepID=A0ABV6NU06_9ACTN